MTGIIGDVYRAISFSNVFHNALPFEIHLLKEFLVINILVPIVKTDSVGIESLVEMDK